MAWEFLEDESALLPQQKSKGVGDFTKGLAARGLESLAGLPSDILEGARGIGSLAASALPESPLKIKSQSPLLTIGKQVAKSFAPDIAEKIPTSVEDILLPTSEVLRKGTKYLTGEKYEPESLEEKHLQELVSTLIPMIATGTPFGRSAKIAGIGQGAKYLSENLPIPEYGKEGIKAGTMLLTSALGFPRAEKYATDLYTNIGDVLKEAPPIPKERINRELLNSIRESISDRSIPKKNIIIENIHAIEKAFDTPNGSVSGLRLWEIKKDINEWLRSGDIAPTSSAKSVLGELSNKINQTLKAGYPDIGADLDTADQIWKGLKLNKSGSKFAESVLGSVKNSLKQATILLLANLIPGGRLLKLGVGLSKPVYSGIKSGYESVRKVMENPGLQKYYTDLIKSIASENKVQAIKAIRNIDKRMDSEEKETTAGWEFVD